MWSNTGRNKKTVRHLSREILGLFAITFFVALLSFWLLNEVANQILLRYVEESLLTISEHQLIDMQYAILGISFLVGIILFVVLFLFLVGERLVYIREIVKGIDALGRHEWSYEIPLKGKNELTELAERVNALSKEEQAFYEKEKQLQHDIRTPLTSMLSYSEYMKQKENLTVEEMKKYMDLVEQKSQQIKMLTNRLLDGDDRHLEFFENGKLLMEQLLEEWEADLEDEFSLEIDVTDCPQFSGEFDVQELRRVFDNLASNIRKYADETKAVTLKVYGEKDTLFLLQTNTCKKLVVPVESTKIGIDSIREILNRYDGVLDVKIEEDIFTILISWKIHNL